MASPELAIIVDMLRSRPQPTEFDVQALRVGIEMLAGAAPTLDGTRCEPVRASGIPCEWIVAPDVTTGVTVLYLHGGGYCIGSLNTHRPIAAQLAAAVRGRALLIDYRLAPEHPFPAAVEDATAAYRWLLAQGVAPERIAIAGDSAGGGLTVATLVALRDAGDALPAAGVCLSPWVDLEGTGPSNSGCAALDPMVQQEGLSHMAAAYLRGTAPRTPLASPLYADLRGLPPLLVQVGTHEILLDDSTRLAARARQAGVDIVLERWDEMIHVFQCFAPMLPEAEQAIARIGEWVRGRLA